MPEDTPTRAMLAQTDRERLLILDRDMKTMKDTQAEATHIMTTMQTRQSDHAVLLERINNKSTLAMWVLGIIAIAVIGAIVAGLAHKAQPQPIEVNLVAPQE